MTFLNWFTASHLSYWKDEAAKKHTDTKADPNDEETMYRFSYIMMRDIPTILTIMFYVLIYQNMELLFSQTRIPSSQEIQKQKKSSRKMMKHIKRCIIFLCLLYAIAEFI